MTEFHRIWIEQCEAAQEIEDEFGTQKALEYLVGEKFLNFLETDPFHPSLFEPRSHPELGEEEIEFDAEEIEDMRKDDIRRCTRDLLLVERAREWLLEAEAE